MSTNGISDKVDQGGRAASTSQDVLRPLMPPTFHRRLLSDAACWGLDVAVALILLIFMAAPMTVLAMIIWLQDGGSPLFAHARVGKDGRTFLCLKFRTMIVDADARLAAHLAGDPVARAEWEATQKLKRDCRVTPIGVFLRRSSLDELPQLFNVLRGEMSLVGPRPIVKAETARYGRFFQHYCSVRPGITGLWQISGRSHIGYRRRVALDRAYVQRRSFLLNCWILAITVPAVLLQRGAC